MIPLVPPIAVLLAKHPATEGFDLSSVKAIISSAAPLSLEIIETIIKKYKWDVLQGYGMTECTLATHFIPPGRPKNGSVGMVMPFYEAKVYKSLHLIILQILLVVLKIFRFLIQKPDRIWGLAKSARFAYEGLW